MKKRVYTTLELASLSRPHDAQKPTYRVQTGTTKKNCLSPGMKGLNVI